MGRYGERKDSQVGSLHAVIIIVLFLALMVTLGVVFYQNFIAGKPAAVETTQSSDETSVITRIAFNSDIYALDYPKEWKSVTTKSDSQADGSSDTRITNPSKEVEVAFSVSAGGLGGACDVHDGRKISYYRINEVPIANLTTTPVYLVETIVDSIGGGYQYIIGLTPDGGETHAAVGDSHCNVTYVGVASTLALEKDKVVKPTIIAKITFPKLQPKTDVAIKDMKQIKDMINTDDYKTAVKILESARKE